MSEQDGEIEGVGRTVTLGHGVLVSVHDDDAIHFGQYAFSKLRHCVLPVSGG